MQVAIKRACAHPQAKQVIVEAHADAVMEAVLKVQATRSAVNDEVIMTMSVLCQEQGAPFSRYLPHVIPHIMAGLIRHEDLQARLLFCAGADVYSVAALRSIYQARKKGFRFLRFGTNLVMFVRVTDLKRTRAVRSSAAC